METDDATFDEFPSGSVVAAVAEATGRSPLELRPLFEVVDPDALDALCGGKNGRDRSITVVFDYCGCEVTVAPDGVQVVRRD